MGFANALGILPKFMLIEQVNQILDLLITSSLTTNNKLNDGVFAETRMNSITSIVK